MKKQFELDKAYDPAKYEGRIYKQWEQSGAFQPSSNPKAPAYTILMPPPNANDDLHLGHTLSTTIEDILIRYARMNGKAALFLPGSDHAGFETQVVFERKLNAKGKSRFDFSREELYRQIWDYVQANKSSMEDQQRHIGASADWTRETFTLDPHVIRRAYETFQKLYDDGLLYRGQRIVNYCTFHGTSFSDLEVTYQEDAGHLWHLRYPVEGSEEAIEVATTRPETMLGDTAVAVHPDDDHYQHLVGRMVRLPITNRLIPVVADTAVDPAFGTGAVKVTPAHDPTDFEIGERHNLPHIQIIGTDGKITVEAPAEFRGQTVAAARAAVVKALETADALIKTEDYTHSVGHCYKCGTVIEPLVIDQWLVRMKPLAADAMRAIEDGQVRIVPESKTRVLATWLENIRDWNISRQIVWGIRIPAFFSEDGDIVIDIHEQSDTLIRHGKTYRRDSDTFDTWFSSGQWPLATLKFPSPDSQRFYPTSVMETGADIIFFWVARMIMLGLYVTGEVPFRTVYLHGLVLDPHGKKMSKSKGNVIAPQPLIEKYGADAMRLGLIANRTAGMNQGFEEKRVEGYRNFCNKLWNVARFTLAQLPDDYSPTRPEPKTPADAWMLARVNDTVREVTKAIDDYRFSEAGQLIYSLLWDDFADWYIEASKVEQNPNILYHTLSTILTILHPMAPFVTEAIWEAMPAKDGQLIAAPWPQAVKPSSELLRHAAEFDALKAVVQAVRTITAEEQLAKPTILTTDTTLAKSSELITRLARAAELKHAEQGSGLYLSTTTPAWIAATPEQVGARKHRLEQQRAEKQAYLESLAARLANEAYVKSAPAQVVQDTRDRREETLMLLSKLNEQLAALEH
ncbi:MAG TPA: valine--tRNA ligase [Candidatus Saccharimonadia bacterium]